MMIDKGHFNWNAYRGISFKVRNPYCISEIRRIRYSKELQKEA